jgi:penicillin-binding protein A
MKNLRALKVGALFVFVGSLSVGVTSRFMSAARSAPLPFSRPVLTKDKIAELLSSSALSYQFPTELDLSLDGREPVHTKVNYTFDAQLQKVMQNLFESYSPDYGAFVAMDAKTGKVLSMVSYSRDQKIQGNLALRATFPSASVFKVVTAAAAIEGHQVSANTVIPFNGRNHTLYKSQILKSNVTRWTKFISLKEAFGHSINTVFGRIGAYTVGPTGLRTFAGRFGFNHKIAADLPIQEGHAWIPEDAWGLAESASGYTRDNTMSPMQGALIAASVANRGVMMEPYMVQSISEMDGNNLYLAAPKVSAVTMGPSTANEIKTLMKETVLRGTSRHAFRGFFKKGFSLVDVGGKTGSLTGLDPRGKYDWFVGYADSGDRRIAVAALTIHEKLWRVKSGYLARRAIETYFKDLLHHDKTVAKR